MGLFESSDSFVLPKVWGPRAGPINGGCSALTKSDGVGCCWTGVLEIERPEGGTADND